MSQTAGSPPKGNEGLIDPPGRGKSFRFGGNFTASRATGRMGASAATAGNPNADGALVRKAPADGRLVPGNAGGSGRR